MTIKSYVDAWFKTEKDRFLSLFNDKVEAAKEETKAKEKELWTAICEKVLKHMELNDIELDQNAKPIYYNGYHTKVWFFRDNGVLYKFRKEDVSSNDGYTRYKITLSGSYPSDTDDNTVIGFEEDFEADSKTDRKFYSYVSNSVIDIIDEIENYDYTKSDGRYKFYVLNKLNKIIEKIKG